MRILKNKIFFDLYFMTPYCHTLMLGYMSGFSAHRQGIRGEELVSLLPDTFSMLTFGCREEIFLLYYLAALRNVKS